MKKVTIAQNQALYNQLRLGAQSTSTLLFSRIQNAHMPSFSVDSLKKLTKKVNKKNAPKIVFPLVLLIVGVVIIASVFSSDSNNSQVAGEQKIAVKPSLEKIEVNREFSFPITDENGKKVGDFKYIIESAELTDEIIVQGKRATSVEGRVFLIANLKIVNNITQGIQINSRDFIRLGVNGSEERIAPDIHNDPVEAQAIATKYTRVGFAIDTSADNHVLYIGELSGEKIEVPLEFK